jgi:hypothetical protein
MLPLEQPSKSTGQGAGVFGRLIGRLSCTLETVIRQNRHRQWNVCVGPIGIRSTSLSGARGTVSHEDASDLTQAFFARKLLNDYGRIDIEDIEQF